MADESEFLLGQPELSELLMRSLFLKGDLPQTLVVPYATNIQLADLTAPEYQYLRRWKRYHTRAAIAAGGAGNFTMVCFAAPQDAGRTTMAVVDAIWIRSATATPVIRFGIEGDVFNLSLQPAYGAGAPVMDDRSAIPSSPTGVPLYNAFTTTQLSSPLTSLHWEWVVPNTFTQIMHVDPTRPFVLTNRPSTGGGNPRSILYFCPTASNVGLDVCLSWRERVMLETET